MSPDQASWHGYLIGIGHQVQVCAGWKEAMEFCNSRGTIRQRKSLEFGSFANYSSAHGWQYGRRVNTRGR